MRRFSLFFIGALLGSSLAAQTPRRAVLVTGATSGIGRAIAERLSTRGYFVYAGARSSKDIAELSAIPNVKGIQLDVTSAADIAAAVETVKREGRGLYGLVNNAGILVIAPLTEASDKDVDDIINVNLYGPLRVTRAFAPLLIESKGRVVNISSLNGIVAQPAIGLYSMTKHAIEAYTDALAGEMSRVGVRVSAIEPGNFRTELAHSASARIDTAALARSQFSPLMRGVINGLRSLDNAPPPDLVADAVLDAFSSANPRPRYLVVPVAAQAEVVMRKLLTDLVDLNDSQQFRYDRETLVRMLDEALARARK